MSAEPLRHYYVHNERDPARGRCEHRGCALPQSDPVHLEPGDDEACLAAIQAASRSTTHRTEEQNDAVIARADAKRAGRYTFGTTATGESTVTLGDGTGNTWGASSSRGPSASG